MSSTIFNLSPSLRLPGRGFNSFIINKNSLGSDLSISILTAVTFLFFPKLRVKSLKYVEFCIWDIKFLELESKDVFPPSKVVKDNSVLVPDISFILKAGVVVLNIFLF